MNIYEHLQVLSVGSTTLLPPAAAHGLLTQGRFHRQTEVFAFTQLSHLMPSTGAPAADPALPFPLLSLRLHAHLQRTHPLGAHSATLSFLLEGCLTAQSRSQLTWATLQAIRARYCTCSCLFSVTVTVAINVSESFFFYHSNRICISKHKLWLPF